MTLVRTVAIVQARVGSVRFPNKVVHPIAGTPMIELLLARLTRSRRIDAIIVAIPDSTANGALAELVTRLGFRVYRGSEHDVLDRYYHAAALVSPEHVVRITADCPLIDPDLVDRLVDLYDAQGVDYASNNDPPTFPHGLDAEVMSLATLRRAWQEARQPNEREHVTPYLRKSGKFRKTNLVSTEDLSTERWTVDEPEDLEVVSNVFLHFAPRIDFEWREVLALAREQPQLFAANRHLTRSGRRKLWNA